MVRWVRIYPHGDPATGPPGSSGIGRGWEVSTITKPVTVDEYDQMIEDGTIGENDRVELWDGTVVPKMPKNPRHRGPL